MCGLVARIKELYERNPLSRRVVEAIHKIASEVIVSDGGIRIMNFCGTHEWTITYYGIRSLMPPNVELIAGPGCPVCVTPGHYVEALVKLSMEGITVLTYGDAYKLPSKHRSYPRSLADARASGGKVKVVYSFYDAIKVARDNPGEEHVFFAVGFETTMPAVAGPLHGGVVPANLKVLSAYRFTPPIMKYLLENVKDVVLHGVIAPGHVSAVIGSNAWRFLPEEYGVPTVVSGFEPVDVLLAILAILKQLKTRKPELINEYRRVVKPEGNGAALKIMEDVFEVVDSYWRGIGIVAESGAVLKDKFIDNDASRAYGIKEIPDFSDIMPGCKCGEVSLGKVKPTECPLFMKACTPETPFGPCMVSSEGTCRIWAENLPQIVWSE